MSSNIGRCPSTHKYPYLNGALCCDKKPTKISKSSPIYTKCSGKTVPCPGGYCMVKPGNVCNNDYECPNLVDPGKVKSNLGKCVSVGDGEKICAPIPNKVHCSNSNQCFSGKCGGKNSGTPITDTLNDRNNRNGWSICLPTAGWKTAEPCSNDNNCYSGTCDKTINRCAVNSGTFPSATIKATTGGKLSSGQICSKASQCQSNKCGGGHIPQIRDGPGSRVLHKGQDWCIPEGGWPTGTPCDADNNCQSNKCDTDGTHVCLPKPSECHDGVTEGCPVDPATDSATDSATGTTPINIPESADPPGSGMSADDLPSTYGDKGNDDDKTDDSGTTLVWVIIGVVVAILLIQTLFSSPSRRRVIDKS